MMDKMRVDVGWRFSLQLLKKVTSESDCIDNGFGGRWKGNWTWTDSIMVLIYGTWTSWGMSQCSPLKMDFYLSPRSTYKCLKSHVPVCSVHLVLESWHLVSLGKTSMACRDNDTSKRNVLKIVLLVQVLILLPRKTFGHIWSQFS